MSVRPFVCDKSKPLNSIKSIISPHQHPPNYSHHHSHHHTQHHTPTPSHATSQKTSHPTSHTHIITHTPSHMLSHTLSNKPSTTTNPTKPHTILPPLTHPSSSFNFATFKLFSLLDSFRLWNFVKSIILAFDMEV